MNVTLIDIEPTCAPAATTAHGWLGPRSRADGRRGAASARKKRKCTRAGDCRAPARRIWYGASSCTTRCKRRKLGRNKDNESQIKLTIGSSNDPHCPSTCRHSAFRCLDCCADQCWVSPRPDQ